MKARRRGPWIIPEERKQRQEQHEPEEASKYICEKCNKLFIRKGNYENHIKVCNE